jgi:hypothetical protein
MTKYLQNLKATIPGLLLSFALVSASLAWSNPSTFLPPKSNTLAPINSGSIGQIKTGSLFIDALDENNTPYANGLIVGHGNVGIGTTSPGTKLEVAGGAIKATDGLIIETRTSDGNYETGRLWLRTDISFVGPFGASWDIGFRINQGTTQTPDIISVAIEQQGTLSSPLRIAKNNQAYGVILVDEADASASKVKIVLPGGVEKFLKKI